MSKYDHLAGYVVVFLMVSLFGFACWKISSVSEETGIKFVYEDCSHSVVAREYDGCDVRLIKKGFTYCEWRVDCPQQEEVSCD